MRHKVSKPTLNSEINVTPMADVMLVLLIIFIITLPIIQPSITVVLPRAAHAQENPDFNRDDALIVAVTRDGSAYLNKKRVAKNDLEQNLRQKINAREKRTLFVKGDTAVAYGRVVELVDLCRTLGVERIGLITERLRQTNQNRDE